MEQPAFSRNRLTRASLQYGALFAVIVGICFATLWPNHRAIENRAAWSEDGPGVEFRATSQAISDGPFWFPGGEFTIELWLDPDPKTGRGSREILTLIDDFHYEPLRLAQIPSGFLLNTRPQKPPKIPISHAYVLEAPSLVSHIAVIVSLEDVRLYLNGKDTQVRLSPPGPPNGATLGGRLVIGSSASGWKTWQGRARAVAVHERALTPRVVQQHALDSVDQPAALARHEALGLRALYLLTEGEGRRASSAVSGAPDLVLPNLIRPPFGRSLHSVSPLTWRVGWYAEDIMFNILGFVPLGFLLAWRRRRFGIAIAMSSAFLLSLFIELSQLWIPGRFSSGIDLITNTAGASLGALLAWGLDAGLRSRLRP
jgi:hypothetical protein